MFDQSIFCTHHLSTRQTKSISQQRHKEKGNEAYHVEDDGHKDENEDDDDDEDDDAGVSWSTGQLEPDLLHHLRLNPASGN